MTKLEAIVGGRTYILSDRLRYIHLGNDGFGLPGVKRESESGPLQHGATDTGFNLEPRIIQLALAGLSTSQDGYFNVRDELLRVFKPRSKPIQLRFTLPDGTVRQIDCHYSGGLSLPSQEKFGPYGHKVGIALTAPDPTWYDPVATTVKFDIEAGGGAFNIPLAIPWSIGSSVLDKTTTIQYHGTWAASPIITIYGPIRECAITNITTGEKLTFRSGVTIGAGVSYTIDTRYGYQTVTRNDGANRMQDITDDSNLSTFHVESDPDALNGINDIRVTGLDATTQTAVYCSFNTRYIGL